MSRSFFSGKKKASSHPSVSYQENKNNMTLSVLFQELANQNESKKEVTSDIVVSYICKNIPCMQPARPPAAAVRSCVRLLLFDEMFHKSRIKKNIRPHLPNSHMDSCIHGQHEAGSIKPYILQKWHIWQLKMPTFRNVFTAISQFDSNNNTVPWIAQSMTWPLEGVSKWVTHIVQEMTMIAQITNSIVTTEKWKQHHSQMFQVV